MKVLVLLVVLVMMVLVAPAVLVALVMVVSVDSLAQQSQAMALQDKMVTAHNRLGVSPPCLV